jgi:PAS domain S-box-containing protein
VGTVKLLVANQLLVTLFITALFWFLQARLGEQRFFRWWAWAWSASTGFLLIGFLALELGPAWTWMKGSAVLLALLFGLLQIPLLLFGVESARGQEPGPRQQALRLGLVVAAGVACFAFSLPFRDDSPTSYAIRATPRSLGLVLAFSYCAWAFWQRWRRSHSWAAAITVLFCMIYAMDQLVYMTAEVNQIVTGLLGRERLWVMSLFASPIMHYLDLAAILGIAVGMIHLLLEEHQRAEQALEESKQHLESRVQERTQQLVDANTTLQMEMRERQRMEEALRSSEHRYRALFEDSPIALFEEDLSQVKKAIEEIQAAGFEDLEKYFDEHPEAVADCAARVRVSHVNNATLRLYEVDNPSFFQGGLRAIFTEDAYRAFRRELLVIAKGETSSMTETIGRTGTGKHRHVVVHWSVLPGHERTLGRVIVSVEDVTERKLAEQALRESEAKFRTLAETAACAIWFYRGSEFLYASPAVEKITGYTRTELTRMNVWDIIHPDFRELVGERAQARQAGQPVPSRYEFKIVTKQGEERWLDFTATVTEFRGEPAILGTAFDITESKQVRESLQASEAKFRALTESVASGIFIAQNDRFLYVNPQMEALTGYTQQELLALESVDLVVHPRFRELVRGRRQTRLQGEAVPPRYEFMILTKTGEEKWVDFTATQIEFEGHPAVLGTAFCITERKLAEQALENRYQFEELLSELSASFVNLPASQVDPQIEYWLERLVEFFDVERARIIQPEEEGRRYRDTHAWAVDDLPRPLLVTSMEQLPVLTKILLDDEVWKFSQLDDLPQEAWREKEFYRRLGVRSAVALPLRAGGMPVGVLAFATVARERTWSDELLQQMHLVGEILANALARKRTEHALQTAEREMRQLMASVSDCLWSAEVDPAGRLEYRYYSPVVEKILGRPPEFFLAGTERWFSSIHPEDQARMKAAAARVAGGQVDQDEAEYRAVWPDGSVHWVRDSVRATKLDDGRIRLDGVLSDMTDRKQAEQALMERTTYLQGLIEHSPLAIVVMDGDHRVQICNPAFEKIFLYSQEEMRGGDLDDFLAPGEEHSEAVQFTGRARQGERIHAITRRRRKDGTLVDVEVHGVPLVQNGKFVGFYALYQDITERVEIEREIVKQATQLAALIENSPLGIVVLDCNQRIRMCNRAFEELFGYSQEEICGRVLDDLIAPREDPSEAIEFTRSVFEGKRAHATTCRRRKDGTLVDVEFHAVPLLVGEKLIGAYGLYQDITERNQMQEALRNSEARLRLLVETTHVIPWEASAETWEFTYVGPQGLTILGYPLEQWYERDFWIAHLHPEDRERVVDFCQKASQTQEHYTFEYRMLAADGRTVWLNDVVSVARENEKPKWLRGFMIDITERKQAQEQLQELSGRLLYAQEEERRRLARELHDDLTQRLALLAIEAGTLEGQLHSTPGKAQRTLEAMKEQLISLSTDVHQLSRRLHPSILDDLGLVDALDSLCQQFSKRERVAVEFERVAIPKAVPKDVSLCLYRVTQEALRNIAKHAHARRAKVGVARENGGVRLLVQDFGVGFEPAQVRGKQGLGLASMEERIRLLDGKFSLQSQLGHGTQIDVWLPVPGERQ